MAEDEQPKRGRGRPRIDPVGAVRRNVTVQVSADLHEALKEAAAASGLSISRAIEARLAASFSNAQVNEAIDALVGEAVKTARREADEAMLASFHGRSGHLWGRLSADLYVKELMSAALEAGPENASQLSEEFISIFTTKIKDGQDDIIKTWRVGMLFSRLATRLKQADLIEKAREGISTDEEIKEKFRGLFDQLPDKKAKPEK